MEGENHDLRVAVDKATDAGKNALETARAAEGRVKDAEKRVSEAEAARVRAEETLRQVRGELASAKAEHVRFAEVDFPAALEAARAQAVDEYLQSDDFNSRLLAEYQDGMRDMKAGFRHANPTLVGVDWSFVPAESGESDADEDDGQAAEEGEVTGATRTEDEVVVIDDAEPPPGSAAEEPRAAVPLAPSELPAPSDQIEP